MLMFEVEEKEMIDHPSHYNTTKYNLQLKTTENQPKT